MLRVIQIVALLSSYFGSVLKVEMAILDTQSKGISIDGGVSKVEMATFTLPVQRHTGSRTSH
jgi:hypothetical protein